MPRLPVSLCLLSAWLPLVVGCGGSSEYELVPVRGTVVYDGAPVTSGTLVFAPVADDKQKEPGKAGVAPIKSDGSFVVTTYEEGDGAIVGRHQVYYEPAEEQEADPIDEGLSGQEDEPPSAAEVRQALTQQANQILLEVAEGQQLLDITGDKEHILTIQLQRKRPESGEFEDCQ